MRLHRNRARWVGGGIVGSAAVAVTVALLLPSSASAKDPEDALACPNELRVVTSLTHDESVVEPRTPAEIAEAWRGAAPSVAGSRLGQRSLYQPSDTEAKVGYAAARGGTAAVLSFERHPNGWRLESIVECGVTKA